MCWTNKVKRFCQRCIREKADKRSDNFRQVHRNKGFLLRQKKWVKNKRNSLFSWHFAWTDVNSLEVEFAIMTLQGSLKAFLIIFCCSQASYLCQGIIKPDLGVQECLRRAHYRHDPGKFVCRDLGLCYKHYCQQIARRCNSCKRSSVVPCLLIGKNQSDAQGANQYHLHELPEQRSKIQSDSVNATLNAVSDSLLRITTAEIECTGFLAAIPTGRRLSYAVVTAARCIVQFSVSCSTTNKRGNTSEVSQDQNTCFGRKKTRLHSVDKGFRAYSAVIRYKGNVSMLSTSQYICKNIAFSFDFNGWK